MHISRVTGIIQIMFGKVLDQLSYRTKTTSTETPPSVAIIITAKGFDENAMWATKGCLRENGKLIILLTSEDLIKMAEYKISQEDPSTYLLSKLDNLLIELEK